ncbi:hypothetical protein K438DRAFT_1828026 [Mycena galopus ATCC 62051]|nr:hypothetical protein K438DRAFT_1828026 [Mycena galopus ATCC 62051]
MEAAFSQSFRLRVVHRQEGDSPEQQAFRSLLQHTSSGGLSVDEWKELQTRCANNLTPEDKKSHSTTRHVYLPLGRTFTA